MLNVTGTRVPYDESSYFYANDVVFYEFNEMIRIINYFLINSYYMVLLGPTAKNTHRTFGPDERQYLAVCPIQ